MTITPKPKMPIDNSEISVVVQGLIDDEITKKCLHSIRTILPNSKIVLSTWENSKLDNVDFDKLILNKDPGYYYRCVELVKDKVVKKKINNINRQIISTKNGLKSVTTKFALKLRSDFLITHDKFKDKFQSIQNLNLFDNEFRIFEKRVLCCQCGTHTVDKGKIRLPYHYSDFAHFGLTTDLLNLFEIPCATDKEFKFFEERPDDQRRGTWATNQYNAEQTIIKNWLIKNNKNLNFLYSTHATKKNILDSEKFLINNFQPLSYSKFGVHPIKEHLKYRSIYRYYKSYYTENDWLKLYREYQDKNYKVPLIDKERILITLTRNAPKFIRRPLLEKASLYL